MTGDTDNMLATALLESRTRWRDLALLAADLLFETDAAGRLCFLAPQTVLGHDAAALVGRPAASLLAEPGGADPFDPASSPRGMRAWLRCADGGAACLEFTALRISGGLRGIARDVTAEEHRSDATARTLRRTTALVRLLGAAQRSRAAGGAAAAAVQHLLDGIGPALGFAGAALLRLAPDGWQVLAAAGVPGVLPPAPVDGMPRPICRGPLAMVPAGADLALAAWRDGAPDEEDLGVLTALGAPLAAWHGEAGRQDELDRAARTDPLTGLLNRRGFAEAVGASRARRPDGVLAYLDMDGLKLLNDRHGHEAGDAAIRAIAARLAGLASTETPAARLGGDEFALWLPGATETAAALLCAPLGAPGPLAGHPAAGPGAVAASLGLAVAGPADTADALVARADAAMYVRKRSRRAA